MHVRASGIVGTASVVFWGAAVTGGTEHTTAFALLAVGLTSCALWLLWRESVESFEDALGDLAPDLDEVRGLWRERALRATWPQNLHRSKTVCDWLECHADDPDSANWEVFEIAREFYYQAEIFKQESHKVGRKAMQRTASFWILWSLFPPFRLYFRHRRVIAEHRAALIMLAYLEIALADKLRKQGATPGPLGRWARMGQRWPALTRLPSAPNIEAPNPKGFVS